MLTDHSERSDTAATSCLLVCSAKALSKYTEMVDNLIRQQKDKLEAASDEARLRLREWAMPEALQASCQLSMHLCLNLSALQLPGHVLTSIHLCGAASLQAAALCLCDCLEDWPLHHPEWPCSDRPQLLNGEPRLLLCTHVHTLWDTLYQEIMIRICTPEEL